MESCRLLALVVLALLHQAPEQEACSCMPGHFQGAFCSADYVVRARVLSNEVPSEGDRSEGDDAFGTYSFPIKVRTVFKSPDGVDDMRALDQIQTATQSAACGVRLKSGAIYLLTGYMNQGNMTLSLCDTFTEWQHVNTWQRKALLNKLYNRNCDCNVEVCFDEGCQIDSPQDNKCMWNSQADEKECYVRYSMCQENRGGDGSCSWRKNNNLRACRRRANKERQGRQ